MSSVHDLKQKRFTEQTDFRKSPYLLQHAYNPVNWYPWSREAFEDAKNRTSLFFFL